MDKATGGCVAPLRTRNQIFPDINNFKRSLKEIFQQLYDREKGGKGLLPNNMTDSLLREILLNPGQNADTLAELRGLPAIDVLKELRMEAIKRNHANARRLINIEKN